MREGGGRGQGGSITSGIKYASNVLKRFEDLIKDMVASMIALLVLTSKTWLPYNRVSHRSASGVRVMFGTVFSNFWNRAQRGPEKRGQRKRKFSVDSSSMEQAQVALRQLKLW